MRRLPPAIAAVGLSAVLLGCSPTVAMTEPDPTGRTREICTAMMAALPGHVLDQARRTVQPGLFAAAWGDPTITLRCGVDKPPALGDASECLEVNGVGWFPQDADGGAIFTTIGRQAYVQVAVPSAYAPEPNALVDVATAVGSHDPVTTPCR